MKKFYAVAILLLIHTILTHSQDVLVDTPFGPALKSNVHYVSNNHHLNIKDDQIEIIHSKTGIIAQEFRTSFTKNLKGSNSKSEGINGWVTHAYCQILENLPEPTYFSANWIVPSPPLIRSHNLLYLFNGLWTRHSGISHIVQPVLQWGVSPAGGGPYWSICNWYVNNVNQFFYDSLIIVRPGENLQGVIQLISFSDTLYNYNSSFKGYTSGLTINNLPPLLEPIIAFEAYGVKLCNEFPNDEKIRMKDIQINSREYDNPSVIWFSSDDHGLPVMNCGQFTKIVKSSSLDGEIEIYFRPHSISNFDEIQIYPNPVKNFMHINPNIIRSTTRNIPDKVITDCNIEIFDSLGRLVLSQYSERLDYEFNLDLSCLNKGIFIIRFSYDERSHAFKFMKY